MKKILFIGAGSKKDPSFEDVFIDGAQYRKYMEDREINVIDPVVIESCHGCYDIMTEYSKQMQSLVDNGDRVVGVLQGGLYFALPSIQATQVTYPIISVPLDMVAYPSFMVPPGHAAVASVGVEKKTREIYGTAQREKALRLAEKILNLEDDSVDLLVTKGFDEKKLYNKLDEFGIKYSSGTKEDRLLLAYGLESKEIKNNLIVWANPPENLQSRTHFNIIEEIISLHGILEVRGAENLAIYAAKILSLQKPGLREKIIHIAGDKLKSYDKRDLIKEMEVK